MSGLSAAASRITSRRRLSSSTGPSATAANLDCSRFGLEGLFEGVFCAVQKGPDFELAVFVVCGTVTVFAGNFISCSKSTATALLVHYCFSKNRYAMGKEQPIKKLQE